MKQVVNILLYSGGVDSYVAYYYLKENLKQDIIPIYFNLGHKYSSVEMDYIRKYRSDCVIVEDNRFGKVLERIDAHIPNRNALLVLLADSYFSLRPYKFKRIYIGGLLDDRVEDNNIEFSIKMTELLQILHPNQDVEVKSAFDYKFTKLEVVSWYMSNVDPVDIVNKTFSCYQPTYLEDDRHCYSCEACFRRNVALQRVEILPFYNKNIITKYMDRALRDYYHPKRNDSIISYITKWREKYG